MSENGKQTKLDRNASGYYDKTAYTAICNVSHEERRFQKYLDAIFAMSEAAGFHIEERIVVRDLKTGRIWR